MTTTQEANIISAQLNPLVAIAACMELAIFGSVVSIRVDGGAVEGAVPGISVSGLMAAAVCCYFLVLVRVPCGWVGGGGVGGVFLLHLWVYMLQRLCPLVPAVPLL
jgi:hypothetical protein